MEVVGGGIAGLTAAAAAMLKGCTVVLTEERFNEGTPTSYAFGKEQQLQAGGRGDSPPPDDVTHMTVAKPLVIRAEVHAVAQATEQLSAGSRVPETRGSVPARRSNEVTPFGTKKLEQKPLAVVRSGCRPGPMY